MAIGWVNESRRTSGESLSYGSNLTRGPGNPPVSSKSDRLGAQAARTDPKNLQGLKHVDAVPASMPQRSHTAHADTGHVETVGYDPRTGAWRPARHLNTGKHDGGNGDMHATTDNASGMGHSATGSAHGKPQVRPAAAKPRGTTTAHPVALAHGGKNDK